MVCYMKPATYEKLYLISLGEDQIWESQFVGCNCSFCKKHLCRSIWWLHRPLELGHRLSSFNKTCGQAESLEVEEHSRTLKAPNEVIVLLPHLISIWLALEQTANNSQATQHPVQGLTKGWAEILLSSWRAGTDGGKRVEMGNGWSNFPRG